MAEGDDGEPARVSFLRRDFGRVQAGSPSVGLSTLRVSEHASSLVAKRARKKEARWAVGSAEI